MRQAVHQERRAGHRTSPDGRIGGRPALRPWLAALLLVPLLAACNGGAASAGTSGTTGTASAGPTATSGAASSAAGTDTAAGTVTAGGVTTPAAVTAPSATGTRPTVRNDLARNSLRRSLPVDGERFGLRVDYWTQVPTAQWSATSARDLHLAAYLSVTGATAPQVLLDRWTVQWRTLAVVPVLDDVLLDQWTDAPTGDLPGWTVTATYPYASAVTSGGIADALLERWRADGGTGVPSDAALHTAGVDAVVVELRYDLSIRSPGETLWHRRTVLDRLTVPVAG
ncbi:hypothetical protein [Nakamurella endophytica]|nr:hypothetical protein [Nakamurella endophytica]